MKDITKHYTNGEVTIVWKPTLCAHSQNCFKGLPEVFHPKELPWITPEASNTERIIAQVEKCPSGALSYFLNKTGPAAGAEQDTSGVVVEPSVNGPLMVRGDIVVKGKDGTLTHKEKVTAFCRCGASGNKPFCDGSHRKVGFVG